MDFYTSAIRNNLQIPIIESFDDLVSEIRITKDKLYNLYKFNHLYYKTYSVKKRSGGKREIYQPNKVMKAVQSWILRNILQRVEAFVLLENVTGFRTNKSILDNVKFHYGNRYILCIDLKDFFPSISKRRVISLFRKIGYEKGIAVILANLCTCDEKLPQGGVTSPIISNLISSKLDKELLNLANYYNLNYSRYADDLTFSSSVHYKLNFCKNEIIKVINKNKFSINRKKTRILGPRKCRLITGLVLSDEGIGIKRETKKLLRARLHKLILNQSDDKLYNQIKGWLAFLKSVDKKRLEYFENYIKKLSEKHKNNTLLKLLHT